MVLLHIWPPWCDWRPANTVSVGAQSQVSSREVNCQVRAARQFWMLLLNKLRKITHLHFCLHWECTPFSKKKKKVMSQCYLSYIVAHIKDIVLFKIPSGSMACSCMVMRFSHPQSSPCLEINTLCSYQRFASKEGAVESLFNTCVVWI